MEKPYFDDISPRNITTVVDDTAILKCRVKNKGDRTVSAKNTLIFLNKARVVDYNII